MNWSLIWQGFLETCMMTFWTSVISYALGMPLGVLLVITRKDGIRPAPTFNAVLGAIINFLRSIPFILLIAMLIPVTRVVMGTSIGTTASVFPLVVSATPYIARVVEQSFLEVDGGVIEAAKAMGSSTWQIIRKVLIPESVPHGRGHGRHHHPGLHRHGVRRRRRRHRRLRHHERLSARQEVLRLHVRCQRCAGADGAGHRYHRYAAHPPLGS